MSKGLRIDLGDMISFLYQDTLVPEIFDVFGEEVGLKFLMIFGGTTVTFPAYKKVLDLKRNLDIYNELEKEHDQECVQRLAKKYNISDVWVRELYATSKENFKKIEEFLKERSEQYVLVTTKRGPHGEEKEE